MTRISGRVLLCVLAVALLAPATPAVADDGHEVRDHVAGTADPTPDVRFRGAGWGHGVGMSQYGAYARAQAGQDAHEILTSYFPGTTLPDHDTSSPIRVGLRQGVDDVDVRPSGGTIPWRVCDADGCRDLVEQPDGERWHVCPASDETRIQRDACGASNPDEVDAVDEDARLRLDHDGTKIETSDLGGEFDRGQHHIIRDGSELTTVQRLASVEEYLLGIREVPDGWGSSNGQAALQAQAIAARGFALIRLSNPRGGDCSCDILNSVSDQVYRGDHERRAPNWIQAVQSTAGKALTDSAGNIAQTFYSASNGGRSQHNEDVWGGSAIDYLRSIDDPFSLEATNPYRGWTATTDNARVAGALDGDLEVVEHVSVPERTAAGTPRRIDYRGRDGSGREVRGTLSGSPTAGVTLRSRLSSGVDVVRADGTAGVNALPSAYVDRMGFAPFDDDDGREHEYATVWAYEAGITEGVEGARFVPTRSVTRGQMASFIYRTYDIPASSGDSFGDVDPGQPHGDTINALADAGIAEGYDDGDFRPGTSVTRAQMASFLARAAGLEGVEPDGRFNDVASGPHAHSIHAIADAGITLGCRSNRYCPDDSVAREQMTSFLHRAVKGER